MKKLFAILLSYVLMSCFAFGSHCAEFSHGKLCLYVAPMGEGIYKITKTFDIYKHKDMYTLNCQILTPDGKLIDIGACEGDFLFNGVGTLKTKIYLELESEKKVVEFENYYSGLTIKQKSEISDIYAMWPDFIVAIKEKYPVLKSNDDWNAVADLIYKETGNFLSGKDNSIRTYDNFRELIILFIKLTKQLI